MARCAWAAPEPPFYIVEAACCALSGTRDVKVRQCPTSRVGLRDGLAPADGLWIAWPKKKAKIETDLDFGAVQSIGLAAGLVDNKSCSIDDDWQALRFVYRLADRP